MKKNRVKKVLLITLASLVGIVLLFLGTVFFGYHLMVDEDEVKENAVVAEVVVDGYSWGIGSREQQPKTLDEYVPLLAEQIKVTYPKVDQIWAGADFSKYESYLITSDKIRAWKVTPDGSYEEIKPEVVLDQANISGYTDEFVFSEDKNKQAIYLVVSEEALQNTDEYDGSLHTSFYDMYFTIIHEGFHKYEQSLKWEYPETTPGRNEYLENTTGRSYRVAMQELLLEACVDENNRAQYLGNVRYLYDQYNNEFPEEAKNIALYDKLEGSACYFEIQAGIATMYPEDYFGANKEKLIKSYMKAENEASKVTVSDFGAISESYIIGAYAGFLLDEMGTVPDWEEQVTTNPDKSPISVLTEGIEPIEYTVPQEITDMAAKASEEVRFDFEAFITVLYEMIFK